MFRVRWEKEMSCRQSRCLSPPHACLPTLPGGLWLSRCVVLRWLALQELPKELRSLVNVVVHQEQSSSSQPSSFSSAGAVQQIQCQQGNKFRPGLELNLVQLRA